MSSPFRPARFTASRIALAPSVGAETAASSPWKPPIAVRAAPTITTEFAVEVISVSFEAVLRQAERDLGHGAPNVTPALAYSGSGTLHARCGRSRSAPDKG